MADNNPEVKISHIDTVRSKAPRKAGQLKHSNYFITINPNKPTHNQSADEEVCAKLERIVRHMFQEHFYDYLRKLGDGPIEEVNVKSTIEKGSVNHDCHIHIFVTISHRGKYQLDYGKILQDAAAILGQDPKTMHIDHKLVSTTAQDRIQNYLTKKE